MKVSTSGIGEEIDQCLATAGYLIIVNEIEGPDIVSYLTKQTST
jgi:hypothetical protein